MLSSAIRSIALRCNMLHRHSNGGPGYLTLRLGHSIQEEALSRTMRTRLDEAWLPAEGFLATSYLQALSPRPSAASRPGPHLMCRQVSGQWLQLSVFLVPGACSLPRLQASAHGLRLRSLRWRPRHRICRNAVEEALENMNIAFKIHVFRRHGVTAARSLPMSTSCRDRLDGLSVSSPRPRHFRDLTSAQGSRVKYARKQTSSFSVATQQDFSNIGHSALDTACRR